MRHRLVKERQILRKNGIIYVPVVVLNSHDNGVLTPKDIFVDDVVTNLF